MKPDAATLRNLYETQRLTTREIAARYGVRHISVRRWLSSYGIEARASGRGLKHRGVEPPTRDDLVRLVHDEHLSYREIALRYGVDQSAVPHWLKKHGIDMPTIWGTRRKGHVPAVPSVDELRSLYEDGFSVVNIGILFGVSEGTIRPLFDEYGIAVRAPGYDGGKRFVCRDGDVVRSAYERRADDWLSSQKIRHLYEPALPFGYSADFFANGWYIEIWGVVGSAVYDTRRDKKLAMYREHKLPLIQVEAHHFRPGCKKWKERLSLCLSPATIPGLLFD